MFVGSSVEKVRGKPKTTIFIHGQAWSSGAVDKKALSRQDNPLNKPTDALSSGVFYYIDIPAGHS